MITPERSLPVTRQCRLLELARSSVYYRKKLLSDRDLVLMRQIDEIHLAYPFYGSRRIRNELAERGYKVGRSHVAALMRKMGITAIYRKPRTSKPYPEHKIYPYLLKGLAVTCANQVWASDIERHEAF